MRLWPRSIRWQLLAGLVILEVVSLALFAAVLARQQMQHVNDRMERQLSYQATNLGQQAGQALSANRPDWVKASVQTAGQSPNASSAKVTDQAGNILYSSSAPSAQASSLKAPEKAAMARAGRDASSVFSLPGNRMESVRAIYIAGELRGFAWVESVANTPRRQLASIVDDTLVFGVVWVIASAILMMLIAGEIAKPLEVLHRGTQALMSAPATSRHFPLPVRTHNEFGDLIQAFNSMVASIEEQRAGLNDTLSMLDSMLANAPIGLAFFDRRCRFVRVNNVFAEMTGIPLSRHLGRTAPELLPAPLAQELKATVSRVFAAEEPVRNLELNGRASAAKRAWTWLVSAYPVRTKPNQVRWAGVIVLDTSERKRNEEVMRRTEKLAAAGRLAASIAHEINNPLEAITNLLFLLQNYCTLDEGARKYVQMADVEARRITEITQQTLRFYRQSTSPSRTNLADLVDSVLHLYQARIRKQEIQVARNYNPDMDLHCFGGEVRQVIANLVGNALDATPKGGKLLLRARASRDWRHPDQPGIRLTIADTGSGFDREVGEHIFEAFFTTKDVAGTGLGLWVSHEIILRHHGLVHVRSRTGASGQPSGTVFQLFFPDHQNLENIARHPIEIPA